MVMLILIMLFLLSEAQNYMSLPSLCQQKTTKNYQNFLTKDLAKVRIKIQQTSIDIFLNQNW